MKITHAIFYLLISFWGMAQPYSFRHITAADGLLSVQGITMAEDRLGRIWIGSDEGLNLFDGYSLIAFTEPGTKGLLNNRISALHCDTSGAIWLSNAITTQYKPENSHQFISTYMQDGVPLPNLTVFVESASVGLIGAARDSCFGFANGRWKFLPELSRISKKYGRIRDAAHVKDDRWVFACMQQLILVDVAKASVEYVYDYKYPWCVAVLSDSSIAAGSFVRDTTSLIHTYTGEQQFLADYTEASGKAIHGYASKIAVMPDNRLAIATRYHGLQLVDVPRRMVTIFNHDPGNPASIKSDYSLGLFILKSGTLFYQGTGLSYTSLGKSQMASSTFFTNDKGLVDDAVKNCFWEESKSVLWIGTNTSLVKWNRKTGKSNFYPFIDASGGNPTIRTIRSVVADKQGRIWVGTFTGGMGMLKPDGKFDQYTTTASRMRSQLPHREILAIYAMDDGHFFICTNAGFCTFDPVSKKFTTYYDHPQLQKIAGERTFNICIDKQGGWWIAGSNGGWYYPPARDTLIELTTTSDTRNKIVYSIALDSTGNAYLAMADGVQVIPEGTYTIAKNIQKKDGLVSNFAVGLKTDKSGDVWIIGNRGLARYSPGNGVLKTFDPKDGLLQNNHKYGSSLLSADGELFIGGEDGFNYFYPAALSNTNPLLKVFITEAATQDSMFYTPYLSHISLPHRQNNLRLSYQVVDFNLAPYLQYRYMLQGFDTTWEYTGNLRTARYTNLPPGKYLFKAEASFNGKEWSNSLEPLTIAIQRAWWQYWWLQLLLMLMAAAGLYAFYRFRIKQMHEKQRVTSEFEKKISQVRMNMLRAQMNPHFIYNSLNSINNFILKSDRANASGYLTKFSRLMRLILDNSRNEWVSLENDLKALELYIQLEVLRFNEAFSYQVTQDITTPANQLLLPPMLLQPFVENAIWHGLLHRRQSGGRLQIMVRQANRRLFITIADNGIGRQASSAGKSNEADKHKSYGMKITAERLETVNEAYPTHAKVSIKDEYGNDGEATGTTVMLELDCIYSTDET